MCGYTLGSFSPKTVHWLYTVVVRSILLDGGELPRNIPSQVFRQRFKEYLASELLEHYSLKPQRLFKTFYTLGRLAL